jgi:hypothetical protein
MNVRRWLRGLLLILLISAGCATEEKEGPLDHLWRQGYGFNNPNYERARNDLPPVDF